MAVRHDFINDRLPSDAGKRRLARCVNVGDDYTIGIVEGAPKFAPQRFRARIAVRLKHREDAIASGRLRSREGRADLGGMMRVIVHQQKAVALVFDFEATARVLETAQRYDDFREWNSQLGRERDDAERV